MVGKILGILALGGAVVYIIFVADNPPISAAYGDFFTAIGDLITTHLEAISD